MSKIYCVGNDNGSSGVDENTPNHQREGALSPLYDKSSNNYSSVDDDDIIINNSGNNNSSNNNNNHDAVDVSVDNSTDKLTTLTNDIKSVIGRLVRVINIYILFVFC
jgi:hypothetical protein